MAPMFALQAVMAVAVVVVIALGADWLVEGSIGVAKMLGVSEVVIGITIVAFGNAVNLTDGLDGLATMPVIIASVAFLVIVYLVGNVKFADYLGIPHVPRAGELAIFCGAVIGAGLAFLWFNAPPAAVFMGIRAAWHWAARSARSRSSPITRSCWASSAACSWSRRCR